MGKQFLGYNQVTKEYFDSVSDEDKKGYLWFVRTISGDTYSGDVYLGTRHYGHFGNDSEDVREELEKVIGQIPEDAKAEDVISYIDEVAGVVLDEALSQAVKKVVKVEATSSDNNDKYALTDASGNTIEGSEFEIVYDTVLSSGITTTAALGGIAKGTSVSSLSGKSVSDIIDMILFPEVYPTAATKPAIASLTGGSANEIAKVGDIVSVGAVGATFTTGKFNASFTEPAAAYTSSSTLTYTVNSGFSGYDPASGTTSVSADSNAVASLGENKITWSCKFEYSAPTNKPKTSYGNETTKTGATASNNSAMWSASAVTKTKTTTTYGVYPVFTNIASGAFTDAVDNEMPLTNGATINIDGVPSEVIASKHFMFDYPSGRTATLYVKDLQGNYVPYASTYEPASETVTHTINGTDYTYNRLVTTGALQGTGDYQIVLSVALSK